MAGVFHFEVQTPTITFKFKLKPYEDKNSTFCIDCHCAIIMFKSTYAGSGC